MYRLGFRFTVSSWTRNTRSVQSCLFAAFVLGTFAMRLYAQTLSAVATPVVSVPTSAVLSGTVQWTSGATKDEGQVALKVSADGSFDEAWVLSKSTTGAHTSITDGVRACSSTDATGKATPSSSPLCYQQVPWFAPWLAPKLLKDGLVTSTDATSDVDRKAGWVRTKYMMAPPFGVTLKPKKAAALKQLSEASAVYIAVDAKTLLPAQMVVYDHPSSDPASAVEWTTSFEDYRLESGFLLPHHVKRYLQRSLQADVTISQVSLN